MFVQYLNTCLTSGSSDMVIVEASKAMCELTSQIGTGYLETAYSLLQTMLSSSKSIVKYAALKLINKITYLHPQLAAQCVAELEGLVSHVNKSVASMAISVLLKICKEDEVDSLLQMICQFLPETGDEFRVDAIRAIKHLVKRYPSTYKTLVEFLKKCLRFHSTIEFKREIIETVVYIIQIAPQSRDESLSVIVSLIEDCQYESLICKGLEILANEIPLLEKGEMYVRYICNRLILEDERVRASAVTALAKLGHKKRSLQNLTKNILMK